MGNNIDTNNGYCVQNFNNYQLVGPAPRPPRSRPDQLGLGAATLVALSWVAVALLWLASQWLPVLSGSLTLHAAKLHFAATVPLCWFVLSLAGFYYYFSRQLFS